MEHNETLPISIPSGLSEATGAGSSHAEGKAILATFLSSHTCYELLPKSAKVVVFDVDIPVRLAMFALVEHDVTAAPLWDPKEHRFVGLLTVTDFLEILRHIQYNQAFALSFANNQLFNVRAWREIAAAGRRRRSSLGMVRVSPDDSLYTACCMLRRHRLHRLPVRFPVSSRPLIHANFPRTLTLSLAPEQVVSGEAEDGSNAVLSVITYMSILRFLVGRFREAHELFYENICDLVSPSLFAPGFCDHVHSSHKQAWNRSLRSTTHRT